MAKPYVVILTGAGISAESGIPTFRATNGLWASHPIEEVATLMGYQRFPERVQHFYNQRRRELQSSQVAPNAAHFALAELEAHLGNRFLLITQNIDDLHERAGNHRILHMHGELLKARCVHSGKVFPWQQDLQVTDHCSCCLVPAALRPHIVWFGEMPLYLSQIQHALVQASHFLAIGTSGHVYPAAGFVHEAHLAGAHTVEINLEPSQQGSAFDEKYYGMATEMVPAYLHHTFMLHN